MPTTAQNFFPSATEQDYTAPGELDIRKLVENLGGADNSTTAEFSTAAAEIILDPFNARSVTGTIDSSALGWTVNRAGADGMESADNAKRVIPAGSWTFNARLGASAALTGNYRLRIRVYRVTSDGNRSLLFGPIDSALVSPNAVGVDVSATTSQSKITFEQDETLLVSYSIEKTDVTVDAETAMFRLNDLAGNDVEIVLPSPIATDFFRTQTDPLGMLDSRARDIERQLTEAEALADLAVRVRARIVTDDIGVTDAARKLVDLGVIESMILADSISDIEVAIREIIEDGALTDIALRHRSFTKLPIQAIIDSKVEVSVG